MRPRTGPKITEHSFACCRHSDGTQWRPADDTVQAVKEKWLERLWSCQPSIKGLKSYVDSRFLLYDNERLCDSSVNILSSGHFEEIKLTSFGRTFVSVNFVSITHKIFFLFFILLLFLMSYKVYWCVKTKLLFSPTDVSCSLPQLEVFLLLLLRLLLLSLSLFLSLPPPPPPPPPLFF